MKNFLLSILFFSSFLNAQIQLIYFTDAHQLYELDDVDGGRGGIARLKFLVDDSKTQNSQTITIHGGDFVGGVLYGGIYKGDHMVDAFNQIPVDLFNFGQHEFDYGLNHLDELINKSNGKFFTSNLVDNDGNPIFNLPAYFSTEIDGLKILFLAVTDQMSTTKQDSRVQQNNISKSIQNVFKTVNPNVFDEVILLSQMDLEKNKLIVHEFPQISLVLTEEVNEYESQINYIGSTPIIATAGNMSSAAKIQLNKNQNPNIEIISFDKNFPQNPKFEKWEKNEKEIVEALMNEQIGILEIDLNAFESLKKESPAGNLVTDAMREHYKTDFALIDGSGIRNNVEKGKFTLKKIRTLLPFGNQMVVVEIKGKDLIHFVENQIFAKKSKLIQIAGFSYVWDKNQNKIEFPDVEKEKIYTLALNDYNFGKLIHYESVVIDSNHGKSITDYEVLQIYIQKHKNIYPKVGSRITIIENE